MTRPRRLALLVVLLATALAHGRALQHGFVYDDHRFVVRNPALEDLGAVGRFFTDPATASAAQGVEPDVWRPLRTLLFALERAAFGLAPTGWHAVSLALHLLAVALGFGLAARLLARRRDGAARGEPAVALAAGLAAAAFGLHPVTVEAVAWVSSQGDLLGAVLVLLALHASLRPGLRAAAATVALGVLGCLAKESAVVLAALVPLLRLALPRDERLPARAVTARAAAVLLATLGYLAVRQAVLPTPADLPPLAQVDLPDGSRAVAVRAFLATATWYTGLLLAPHGFPFDRNAVTHPPPATWADPEVLLGAGVLASLALAAGRGLRRPSVAPFAAGGALAVLVPVAGVLVPLKAFGAQRFLYLALPGLGIGAVAAGLAIAARRPRLAPALAAVGVVAAGALALATDARTRPWRDELSLWEAVVVDDPMNPRAHEGLGFERLKRGLVDRGQRALRTYQEFQPYDGKVRAENVAALRRLYDELRTSVGAAAEGEVADVRIPSWVLATTITEARAALDAWDRRGLARARGDAALRRATLEAWRGAAFDLGDLLEVLRVTEVTERDDRAAGRAPAYADRRVRPLVAALALSAPPPASSGRDPQRAAARDAERRQVRAAALASAGVDPSVDDVEAWRRLLPHLDALLAERPDDVAARRQRATARLATVDLLPAAERGPELAALEADLAALVARAPGDRALRQALAAVRARRGGR